MVTARLFRMLLLCGLFLAIPAAVFAQPIQPCSFWGKVSIGDSPAPIGTEISAYKSYGALCGTYAIGQKENDQSGYYGFLSCIGERGDNYNVRFTVNGVSAKVNGDTAWMSGATRQVDLSVGASAASGGGQGGASAPGGLTDNILKLIRGEPGTVARNESSIEAGIVERSVSYQNNKLSILLASALMIFVILWVVIEKKKHEQKKRKN
jgi:hypothetical protein